MALRRHILKNDALNGNRESEQHIHNEEQQSSALIGLSAVSADMWIPGNGRNFVIQSRSQTMWSEHEVCQHKSLSSHPIIRATWFDTENTYTRRYSLGNYVTVMPIQGDASFNIWQINDFERSIGMTGVPNDAWSHEFWRSTCFVIQNAFPRKKSSLH